MLLAVELIPQLLPKWLTRRGTAMEINFETYCCNCKFLASRGLVLREKTKYLVHRITEIFWGLLNCWLSLTTNYQPI